MENKISIGIDCDGGDIIDYKPGVLEKALMEINKSLDRININGFYDISEKRESPAKRIISASLRFAKENPSLELILVGNEKNIKEHIKKHSKNINIVNSEVYCPKEEKITRPVKGSSLHTLVDYVLDNKINSFFTIGDTSKVGIESMRLKRLEGIRKPSLVAVVPNRKKDVFLFGDVGATSLNQKGDISYSQAMENFSRDIYTQGIAAIVYAKEFFDNKKLRVGLLANGTEEHKGSDFMKMADSLFKKAMAHGLTEEIDYIGKIEIWSAQEGEVDLLISDGYTGNISIKSMEGTGKLIKYIFEDELNDMSLLEKGNLISSAYVLLKLKKDISKRTNSEKYNGALLLGVRGNIIKGHGSSTENAIYYGIAKTANIAKSNLNFKIEESLKKYSLD